jgi:hypothetical protein
MYVCERHYACESGLWHCETMFIAKKTQEIASYLERYDDNLVIVIIDKEVKNDDISERAVLDEYTEASLVLSEGNVLYDKQSYQVRGVIEIDYYNIFLSEKDQNVDLKLPLFRRMCLEERLTGGYRSEEECYYVRKIRVGERINHTVNIEFGINKLFILQAIFYDEMVMFLKAGAVNKTMRNTNIAKANTCTATTKG